MKPVIVLFALIYLSLTATAQVATVIPPPKVDQRVELLSIVFRLAGNREYNSKVNVSYVGEIHRHFDKFIDHPLIKYARLLRDSSGIGFDAVMSMAIHLNEPPALDPIIPFSTEIPDKRWSVATAEKFTALLKQFYADADCQSFFQAEAANYAIAEKQFYSLYKALDVNWYYRFYGKSPTETFNIIIGLGNGDGNYGSQINLSAKAKKVYAVLGSWSFDANGTPVYESANYLPTLIHEFNHSFVNYLGDIYEKQLSGPGQIIFDKEAARMRRQAYSQGKTMLNEALVRAAVIRYLTAHETDTVLVAGETMEQLRRGFVWMPELADLLAKYEKQRTTYPTLESFMPEVVRFYAKVAAQINIMDDEYVQHCARVISVQPFRENDTMVNPKTTEIIFNFDKKLDGLRRFFGPGKMGTTHYPVPLGFSFSNDNKTIIMKVELKPNTEYQINITGDLMRTYDGYTVQNYLLSFKTANK